MRNYGVFKGVDGMRQCESLSGGKVGGTGSHALTLDRHGTNQGKNGTLFSTYHVVRLEGAVPACFLYGWSILYSYSKSCPFSTLKTESIVVTEIMNNVASASCLPEGRER